MRFKGKQLAPFTGQQPLDRDPCPARYQIRNVASFNLLTQQGRAGCLSLGL